jgi:hypothetical protein
VVPSGYRVDAPRVAAFAAALAVHAAMLAALLASRVRLTELAEPSSTAITWFPEPEEVSLPASRSPGSSSAREPDRPAVRESATSAPITIDWGREATRSAARQIAAADEADRRAGALASRARDGAIELDTSPRPEPEFGWARTAKGIERTEDGGTVLWVSERCMIVLSALMPICRLGKLKVNGELFEHMRDPPEMGDWKD